MSVRDFTPDAFGHLDAVARAVTMTAPIPVELDARGTKAMVWAKLELQLPSGSTKDRIAAHILRGAIDDGSVTPSTTVIEASSGSTSISFAMLCARLGLRFEAVMPEGVSRERLRIIEEFGGTSVLTPAGDGVPGAIDHVRGRAKDPDVFWPDQFNNPRNADAHARTTGPQLLAQLDAQLGRAPDGFVAAVGTAGSLMGMGRVLRERSPGAVIARVLVSGALVDAEQGCVATGIPGVVDCLSGLLDPEALGLAADIPITHAAAMAATHDLRRLGFPVGPSSGLNFAGAAALARTLGPGSHVATVFCDRMERYFSLEAG